MLDPRGKREIKEIVTELRKEVPDLTIISITHDLEETLHSDEIIVMNEGKLCCKVHRKTFIRITKH